MTAATHQGQLARFGAIELDELNQRAAMMTRVDRKYLLDAGELAELLARLDSRVRVLTIGARTGFDYHSVYYDTASLASYRMAALGRERRYKVRRRHYLDSGQGFWEVKTRVGDLSRKQRLASSHEVLDDTVREFVRQRLCEARLDAHDVAELTPVLETSYRRSTLLAPQADARLTIDTRLVWSQQNTTLALDQLAVVETKTAGHASGFDQLLWRLGHRPQRISKYATGLAALHPDLPQARWRRTLRRHFT